MALPQKIGSLGDDVDLKVTIGSEIHARSGDDKVTGSAENDLIFGGNTEWREGGLDPDYSGAYMFEVGDNDTINAGGGDDEICVGTGTDVIDGGAGYNTLSFYYGAEAVFTKLEPAGGGSKPHFVDYTGWLVNVSVDLATGLYGGQFVDDHNAVLGTAKGSFKHIQAIVGSVGRDTINGSSGDDFFKPIKGNDKIDGKGGWDQLSYNDAGTLGIVLVWGTGTVTDSFGNTDTFSNIEHVIGSKNDDSMTGSVGAQMFTGNKGDDTIDGMGGIDTVDYSKDKGPNGVDVVLNNKMATDSWGDTDTFAFIENIRGTERGDLITGDNHANKFWGRGGTDNMGGLGGADYLYGGDGNDTLGGGSGNDELNGEDGEDNLVGGDDNDTLNGGDGKDSLNGNAGDDVLNGEDGNDKLTDNFIATPSLDTVPWTGNSLSGGAGNDTINGVGILHGDADNDTITGQGMLYGDKGNDTLTGTMVEELHSYIRGSTLQGGDGMDRLIEGDNVVVHSFVSYDYASTGIKAFLDTQKVEVSATDKDVLVGFTRLVGSRHDDSIFGSGDSDTIQGNLGDDLIKGSGGDDVIEGDDGEDTVEGGSGDDSLYGSEGDDSIRADAGNDTVHGGGGKDTIHSGSGYDAVFGDGDSDVIYIDGSSGGLGAFTNGGSGNDRLIFSDGAYVRATGGAGIDTFVIEASARSVTINDLHRATDKVDLTEFHLASFAAFKALGKSSSGDLTFELDSNTILILGGMDKSDLAKGDFIL